MGHGKLKMKNQYNFIKMKTNILSLGLLLMLFISCEDKRLDGLEPDKVYLPKSGLHTEESYTTGTTATAQLWTYKSSLNGTSCQVTYTVKPELLAAYNEENGTNYEILPEDCYEIPQSTISIQGKEEYGKFHINYFPEKIVEHCGGVYKLEKYALPMEISSDDAPVTNMNSAILTFVVKEPIIKMQNTLVSKIEFNAGSTGTVNQEVKIGMDFDSKWDCKFTIENDQTMLEEILEDYNTTHNTFYELLPEDAWQLSASEGEIKTGNSSYALTVSIDQSKVKSGYYAIPVLLKSIEKPLQVSETESLCIIPVYCTGNFVSKEGWTITVSSCNPNYGSAQGLIDDKLSTYWHPAGRQFSPEIPKDVAPWAIVDMHANVRISCFEIDPRNDQFYPQIFSNLRCYVSTDGINFTLVGYVDKPWAGLPNNTKEKCIVPTRPMTGRYIKFAIDYQQNQTSLAFAELSIRGEKAE